MLASSVPIKEAGRGCICILGNLATLATWKTGLTLGGSRASASRIRQAQEGPCGSRATVSIERRCGWSAASRSRIFKLAAG
jgi:hypothetical protein